MADIGNSAKLNETVSSNQIVDGTIATADLANDAVDADKLASDAVVNASVASDAAIATSKLSGALTAVTSSGLGTAAARAAEDTMTDGANLPDGAAIKAYGDTNWAAGGITHATGYRVSTNFNGSYDPITAWELIDTADYASLGSIVTVLNGVFTFPSTGIWRVELTAGAYATAASGGAELTTTIEVAGTVASRAHSYLPDNTYGWCTCFHQVDVTDTGTQTINVTCGGGANVNVLGNSTYSRTQLWFTRLGDT